MPLAIPVTDVHLTSNTLEAATGGAQKKETPTQVFSCEI